jgi:hypothetical protein
MSIAQRLVNFSDGLSVDGILSAAKGGTGTTTGAGSSTPTISAINYGGDDTATNPAGGATITLTGTNFAAGAKVLINTTPVSVVTVVSATQITFTAPQLAAGSYILYVVNLDGSTAIAVPGIQYSGTPAWSTAAGTLGTGYETSAVSTTVSATSDSAVTYSVVSGTLPSGVTINASGTISGTSPLVAGSTTYTFTVRATDLENQDTDRSFSLTINPDVVSWSSLNTIALPQNVASTTTLLASSAAGQTVSYAVDTLPTGLTLSGATVSGTPTVAGATITTATATAAVTGKTAQQTITWTVSIAADTYFPLTTLLLNSETTALPFLADASTNNFAITAVGDTKPNNFNPYTPGYYSNYFDGTGDYLTVPTNSAFSLTGNFTIECWLYPTAFSSYRGIWSGTNVINSTGFHFGLNSAGNIFIYANSSFTVTSSNAMLLNTWNHVAVVRNSGVIYIYINGILSTNSWTTSTSFTNAACVIGTNPGPGTEYYIGSISNFRIVNGTAVYTANFTPPSAPLTAITNTALLTCQSNRLIDNSANAFVITKAGDVKVSSFDPFVPDASYATYGSTYFDGTGDYLSIAANSAFAYGTGDFEISFWYYPTSASGYLFDQRTTQPQVASTIYYDSGIIVYYTNGGTAISGTDPSKNAWHYLTLSRVSGITRLFVDGAQLGSNYTDSNNYGTLPFSIGCRFTTITDIPYGGYISNFRVVKGSGISSQTVPTAPLTAVANTQLLTCQTNQPHTNSQFLDNSSSALQITRAGNTTQGSFSPYGANWSNYLPSAGSTYLFGGSSTSLALGSGNFTFEGWFYIQALAPSYSTLLDWRTNGSIIATVPVLSDFNNNGKLAFVYGNGSSTAFIQVVESSTTMPVGSWFHMALVRSGTTVTMYFNGTSVGSATSSQDFGLQNFNIGNAQSTNYTPSMYVSNVRLVKGSAVYTSAFTPSTTPLTAITNTTLLTCQSPRYVDNSINNIALSATTNVSVQKFSPFSLVTQTPTTHSVGFDGTGDYLTLPSSSNLVLGSGDFCVEMWYYQQANAFAALFSNAVSSGGGDAQFELQIAASTFYPTVLAWATTFLTSSVASTPNAWNHIAVCRNGTTLSMFLNGTRVATTTTSNNFSSTNAFHISRQAAAAAGYINGYISNLRVVKGSSVYTPSATTITVPTQPLTAVANTQLLTCQSSTLIDNSVNQFAITAFGDAKPRRQNPFGSTTSSAQDYTTSVFGGSAYFDGSADYLNMATASTDYNLTGDFTLEAWVYPTVQNGGTWTVIDARASGATAAAWIFNLVPSGGVYKLGFYTGTQYSGAITVPLNNWTHIAWERTGSVLTGYVNGVRDYYNASYGTGAINPGSTAPRIGSKDQAINADYELKGYMTDVRFVKGSAVYKAAFVPPTTPLQAVPNTTLLLNMDRAAISDKSGKVVTETVGDAKVSTVVKKYGSASLYFDGSDYLSANSMGSGDLGTGDFTIEYWMNSSASGSYSGPVGTQEVSGAATAGMWRCLNRFNNANGIYFAYTSGGTFVDVTFTTTNYNDNTWHHIAYVKSGTSLRAYVDGVQVGSAVTVTQSLSSGKKLTLAYNPQDNAYYTGYVDDLRITRGYARYTANFTPPTSALLTK